MKLIRKIEKHAELKTICLNRMYFKNDDEFECLLDSLGIRPLLYENECDWDDIDEIKIKVDSMEITDHNIKYNQEI